jgi:YHS domain-containing protein
MAGNGEASKKEKPVYICINETNSLSTKYIHKTVLTKGISMTRLAVLAMVFTVAGAACLLGGCERKDPIVPKAPERTTSGKTEPNASAAAVEQTTCPVMGGPIDKNIFVVYQGKKVYFCCSGCPAEFQKDPAKYISKLPQFK